MSDKTESGAVKVREATQCDMPSTLKITNFAIRNTFATFQDKEDEIELWTKRWKTRSEFFPFLVAEKYGTVTGFAMAGGFHSR